MLPSVWLLPAIRNLAISTHGSWLVQVHQDDDDDQEAENYAENIDYNGENINDDYDDNICTECLHTLP